MIIAEFLGKDLDSATSYEDYRYDYGTGLDALNLQDNDQLINLALADFVLNNRDRHGNNVFIGKDEEGNGYLIPIDNEFSFREINYDFTIEEDLDELQFALDEELSKYTKGLNPEDLKNRINIQLQKIQRTLENMKFVDDENRSAALDRVEYLSTPENQEAIVKRMRLGQGQS